ncbi:MAG: glycosyltransferase family 9 protein [Bacteroidetes bacterium]|nr:glycosyltransferase family 9 protein [Bacteroidota bacterium]
MSSAKHKQALVFISAGVGDAILLVPLVNELKKQHYKVTGLFTSAFHCESIFKHTDLFDAIVIKKQKASLLLYTLVHLRGFDKVFMNHFSFSHSHLSVAALLGKDVYTNYKDMTALQSSNAIHFIEPRANTHDALQNVFLLNNNLSLQNLNFDIHYKPTHYNTFRLSSNYISLQISSANNKAPYKNWAPEKWLHILDHLGDRLPDTQLVILGDDTELHFNDTINSLKHKNIISLIGQTQLSDVVEIIYHSKFYIGLDSGLMHIAAALHKPTFTIWGASNPTLYGYNWLGERHRVVSLDLPCAPCSSWIQPNTTRVSDPLRCPDFKCIRDISFSMVIKELDSFIKTI